MQKTTGIYSMVSVAWVYEMLMTLLGGKRNWQISANVDCYDFLEVSA